MKKSMLSWDEPGASALSTLSMPHGEALYRTTRGVARALAGAEDAARGWMSRHGVQALRIGVGLIYVWFGALKLSPTLSPAEQLVAETFRFLDPRWFLPCLGLGEMAIGASLIFGVLMRFSLPLLFMHMAGTVLPFFVLPHATWARFPFALTLEGQYIVKNVVIVGAAFVIAGGRPARSADASLADASLAEDGSDRAAGSLRRS